MAYDGEGIRYALPANADLSASQFCAVVVNNTGKVAVAGANVRIDGILEDTPNAAGKRESICGSGITRVKAGGAVTAGDLLETDSSGRAVTSSTAGHLVFGVALASASGAGSLIPVRVFGHPYLHP